MFCVLARSCSQTAGRWEICRDADRLTWEGTRLSNLPLVDGLFTDDLRDKESAKIECGKAHLNSLAVGETPAEFVQARNIDDLVVKC
jgi:hypothetical protein